MRKKEKKGYIMEADQEIVIVVIDKNHSHSYFPLHYFKFENDTTIKKFTCIKVVFPEPAMPTHSRTAGFLSDAVAIFYFFSLFSF